ncbi:SPOR domain-containing protein [uncultured Thiohalocapsa sp.]|uniref:SPOR domain-containing protein n=1 Tax=uncultured Thiohalocapsa sp. TaxID=768990 RepID=UPI0025E89B8A|nr:SPOR domain-containing protein [uncultured Thiohalocapsa sp.]
MTEPCSPRPRCHPEPAAAPRPPEPPPRLDDLTRLRERLADLQTLSRAQEEQWSQLANRIGALERAAAPDAGLAARVDAVAAEVTALRDLLAAPFGGADPGPTALLGLAAANDDAAHSASLEQRLTELADALTARLDGLEAQVTAARTYARRQAETQRAWNDARRRRSVLLLGGPFAAALAMVGLLAAGAWWQLERQAAAMDRRLAALDEQASSERHADRAQLQQRLAALQQEITRLEGADATLAQRQREVLAQVSDSALMGDLLARLRRLEAAGGDSRRAAMGAVAAGERTAAAPPQRPGQPAAPHHGAVAPAPWLIQLIGFRDAARLKSFALEHGLAGADAPGGWMSTGRWRGAPWHTLYLGGFRTRAEAARAMGALPPALAQLDPILRRRPADLRLTRVMTPGDGIGGT